MREGPAYGVLLHIIPSKLIGELHHSARLGKTFLGGWVGKSWEKG